MAEHELLERADDLRRKGPALIHLEQIMLEFVFVGNIDTVAVKRILLERKTEAHPFNCFRVIPVQPHPASVVVEFGFLDCLDVEWAV